MNRPQKQTIKTNSKKKLLKVGASNKYTDTEISTLAKYPSNTHILTPFGKNTTDVETAYLPIEVAKKNDKAIDSVNDFEFTEGDMSCVPEERTQCS